MSSVLGIMRISSPLLHTQAKALPLMASAFVVILLFTANNVTITNAQQQQLRGQQQSAPTATANQNQTTTSSSSFQSTEDSFRMHVPRGWSIHDMDNTGFSLLTEVLQGYGLLAQLCSEERQQQQQQPVSNVGSNNNCQASEGDIIHIIRYPNLGARLGFSPEEIIANSNSTLDDILAYEMQSLQEVGYRDIQIVNSTYTTINADISKAAAAINENNGNNNNANPLPPIAKVPAKLVEMTYRTDSAPNEIKTGYYLLTATNVTPRNLGMITGYSLFYESGNSATGAAQTSASGSSSNSNSSLAQTTTMPLPAAIRQVFDSFELIAGQEAAQDILSALAAQAQQAQPAEQPAEQSQEQPTSPLTGELTSNATTGDAPATFEFEANIEGGTEPYTYNWDFDDGSEESDDESVVHTFDDAGTYTVTATVTDSQDQTASASIEITVEESSPVQEAEGPTTPQSPQDLSCDTAGIGCESESNGPSSDDSGNDNSGSDNNPRDLFDLPNSGLGSDNNSGSPERGPDIRIP